MPTIVHSDAPSQYNDRAADLYRQLFEWRIEPPPGPMEYCGIMTTHQQVRPDLGGSMGKKNEWDTGMMNYVGVRTIDETADQLIGPGGKAVLPRTEMPG